MRTNEYPRSAALCLSKNDMQTTTRKPSTPLHLIQAVSAIQLRRGGPSDNRARICRTSMGWIAVTSRSNVNKPSMYNCFNLWTVDELRYSTRSAGCGSRMTIGKNGAHCMLASTVTHKRSRMYYRVYNSEIFMLKRDNPDVIDMTGRYDAQM